LGNINAGGIWLVIHINSGSNKVKPPLIGVGPGKASRSWRKVESWNELPLNSSKRTNC
jgi:hypothetical protein